MAACPIADVCDIRQSHRNPTAGNLDPVFPDADFANRSDPRSVSGYLLMLNNRMVM